MEEADFHETVRQRGNLDSVDDARRVTQATLGTLGERLSDGEVADIAPLLPDEVADPLLDAGEGGTAGFAFDEFVERVAEQTEETETDAIRHARAVGATLVEAVGREEIHDARSQLPNEYDRLFWAANRRECLDLVRRERAIDSDNDAYEALTATLGALGERLSHGQARDVAAFLPPEFSEAILAAETPATDLSAEEFLERVIDRTGTDSGVARTYVQASTAALAEALPDYEYRNVLDQLPNEYGPLLGATVSRDEVGR